MRRLWQWLKAAFKTPQGEQPVAPPGSPATDQVSGDGILDLRHIDAIDLRIVGTVHVLPDSLRQRYQRSEYLLVLEPRNRHDPNAIAVYSGERKVGYLSAAKAASYAPVLRHVDAGAFRVGGTTRERKSALIVLLPKLPPLRAYLRSL